MPNGASASRSVLVYVPAFAGTHCAYPRRDWPGWVDLGGWLHTEMVYAFADSYCVTHPSTKRAWRWSTSLMRPATLPTEPDHLLINRHRLDTAWVKCIKRHTVLTVCVSECYGFGVTAGPWKSKVISRARSNGLKARYSLQKRRSSVTLIDLLLNCSSSNSSSSICSSNV